MFRLTRCLLRPTKVSTQIAGLDVIPNARQVLISLYERTMDICKTNPHNELYAFKQIYNNTKYELRTLISNTDDDVAARKLDVLHLEQLVQRAEQRIDGLDALIEQADLIKSGAIDLDDSEYFANRPPMFGSAEHLGYRSNYPLEQAVIDEIATGKVGLTPNSTKPISVAFLKQIGITPTAEQITECEEALKTVTDEEKAAIEAKKASGVNFVEEYFLSKMDQSELDHFAIEKQLSQ